MSYAADDFDAIHEALKQLQSPEPEPCSKCKGVGWVEIPMFYGYPTSSFRECDACGNPNKQGIPGA